MKQPLIGILVVIGALVVGVGGAFGVSRLLPTTDKGTLLQNDQDDRALPDWNRRGSPGMMGPQGFRGMMPGYGDDNRIPENAIRLTIDEAQAKAEAYAKRVGDNLKVVEVMEFSNNFYAVAVETDTKKAAFEMLIDPYTGQVGLEMGAGNMWNQKYGHMNLNSNPSATNTLSMKDAAAKAQSALDSEITGAVVQANGFDFYGYYSFDYEVNGKVAGMLSVNGETGQVFFHFWHSTFINEKEIS